MHMEQEIAAGAWKVNITPPVGIPIAGDFTEVLAQEIADEIYVSAIVLEDGKEEIAIVSADLSMIPDDVYRDITNRIEEHCGIKRCNILLGATHTHTAPAIGEAVAGVVGIWPEYAEMLKKSIVTSVIMAKRRKKPARIGVGKGKNEKFAFNRRLKKPDGSIIMNWTDKAFLQDCTETGAVDPEVTFICFEDLKGKLFGLIVNYANHNNAMAYPVISADWAGVMAKTLSKVYGEELITLFLPGASGNMNWINFRDVRQGYGPELVKKLGMSLAGTVLESIPEIEYPEIEGLTCLHQKITLSDRPWRDYDTQRDMTFGRDEESSGMFFRQYEMEKQLFSGKPLPAYEVDIHVVAIGKEIAIATNPGELFAEFGLQIKAASPFKYTLISELTNGYAGYICTEEAFDEGGYEVRKTKSSSHLEIEAGKKIVETSVSLLNRA